MCPRNMAIDERMVKSRHRSGFRQFIKDKPTKWGMNSGCWLIVPMAIPLILTSTSVQLQGKLSVNTGLGMMLSCVLWPPTLGRDTIFLWTIFTPPLPFLNIFMIRVSLPRVQFYQARVISYPPLKKAKSGLRVGSGRGGGKRWVRDPPCLVLQWVENKVLSMITTVGNANEQGQVTRRLRTDGEWEERLSLKFLRPTT